MTSFEIMISPIKAPTKCQEDSEIPILSLVPFQKPPTVSFNNVPFGLSQQQQLRIQNQSCHHLQIEFSKIPSPEHNFTFSDLKLELKQFEETSVTISWTPNKIGSWRETIYLNCSKNSRMDFPVHLLFNCVQPIKKVRRVFRTFWPQRTFGCKSTKNSQVSSLNNQLPTNDPQLTMISVIKKSGVSHKENISKSHVNDKKKLSPIYGSPALKVQMHGKAKNSFRETSSKAKKRPGVERSLQVHTNFDKLEMLDFAAVDNDKGRLPLPQSPVRSRALRRTAVITTKTTEKNVKEAGYLNKRKQCTLPEKTCRIKSKIRKVVPNNTPPDSDTLVNDSLGYIGENESKALTATAVDSERLLAWLDDLNSDPMDTVLGEDVIPVPNCKTSWNFSKQTNLEKPFFLVGGSSSNPCRLSSETYIKSPEMTLTATSGVVYANGEGESPALGNRRITRAMTAAASSECAQNVIGTHSLFEYSASKKSVVTRSLSKKSSDLEKMWTGISTTSRNINENSRQENSILNRLRTCELHSASSLSTPHPLLATFQLEFDRKVSALNYSS